MAGFFGEGGQPPVSSPMQTAGQFTFLWIVIKISHEMATTGQRVQCDEGEGGQGNAPENRQRARRVQPAPG
ncbi:hypothetical protein [Xanthomonas sp. 3498]|uniref:hypothetical protein n=1 Tax=Xanthomonas sp. 3498 TaxID=2663863 RepID=UPI00161F2349|nr:hypothetical protein [Xanthomonas sp. 3498]MBB5874706.1 hypothetical protein [Xanthomonas sp. 3498]